MPSLQHDGCLKVLTNPSLVTLTGRAGVRLILSWAACSPISFPGPCGRPSVGLYRLCGGQSSRRQFTNLGRRAATGLTRQGDPREGDPREEIRPALAAR